MVAMPSFNTSPRSRRPHLTYKFWTSSKIFVAVGEIHRVFRSEVSEHYYSVGLPSVSLTQYLSDLESLTLDGKWKKLETISWTSHLSCHDHLVYWKGENLCDRVFESLPSVVGLKYTEECLLEVNSSVTFLYQRVGPARVEWRDVFRGISKPLQVA